MSTKFDIRKLAVTRLATGLVKEFSDNPRDHSDAHVNEVAESITAFGMVDPILCDENYVAIAGHATLRACKKLGMKQVPVIILDHLSDNEKRALRIAHNRLTENGQWNLDRLATNFEILTRAEIDFKLEVTGYTIGEIDVARMGGKDKVKAAAKANAVHEDVVVLPDPHRPPVSQLGDRFEIGQHILVCGDMRERPSYDLALGNKRADLVIADLPYNIPARQIGGLGKVQHPDFLTGYGEMTRPQYRDYCGETFSLLAAFSKPGAFNMSFTDWRVAADMIAAGEVVYERLEHICIWAKTNAGMGSLWRGQYEMVLVFGVKGKPPRSRNNVMLGKYGRHRSDLWTYAGVNAFRPGRMEELSAHPTAKPVPLLKDAILDVTPIGGLVLDPCVGSGSTIVAAHEAGRCGFGIELDPHYLDVAIRRVEEAIGKPAVHQSGKTFAELKLARSGDFEDAF